MEQTLSNRRRYLTEDELEKLMKAARNGRYGRRDATLMLLMARHGLRVTEAIDLRWDQIDFSKGHFARSAAQRWYSFRSSDPRPVIGDHVARLRPNDFRTHPAINVTARRA